MRRILLILPDWLGAESDSVLRQRLPALERLTETGSLTRLSKLPATETPEALTLGLRPDQIRLAQGPLTISALGADPPERSLHFHLSPMSLVDGNLAEHSLELPPETVDAVMSAAKVLNTRSLTIVPGERLDHGLVWEGVGDLHTESSSSASGKPVQTVLPQGDNENALRRFIDDSVNVLSELELNAMRVDKGLQPINILWPWGHGLRTPVPNLALLRGEPVHVMSSSLRLQGLTRLAGYRHADRRQFRSGLNTPWTEIQRVAMGRSVTIVWSDAFTRLRSLGQLEEAAWLTKQIDEAFLSAFAAIAPDDPMRLAVLSPSAEGSGLGLVWHSAQAEVNAVPFDERALEERLPNEHLHEAVARWIV